MDDSAPPRKTGGGGDEEPAGERDARHRRESSHEELRDADDASYTGRPGDDHPEEGGSTRDQDDEAVERTGSQD